MNIKFFKQFFWKTEYFWSHSFGAQTIWLYLLHSGYENLQKY